MNVLSLFDGMSCAQIALNRIGVEYDKYFASEVDKYAIKVTQANYPDTIQLGCIEDVDEHTLACLPEIGLLIGGSPCQGFSFAGKGLNFNDPRSKLFFEYVRILHSLKKAYPDMYFLLENVKMKKEFQDQISSILGVEPIEINSNLVSAQNRRRLYWTNIEGITQPLDKKIMLEDIVHEGYHVDREKSHCIDANYWKGGNLKSYFEKHRRQLVFTDKSFTEFRKLTPMETERLQTIPEDYTNHVSSTQRHKMIGNAMTVDVIGHILGFMPRIALCGCLEEDVTSSWCGECQVTTTFCHHNSYGTCQCS